MQIVLEDGTMRQLEDYEVYALEAARAEKEAEDASHGVFRQYPREEAVSRLLGIMANQVDIPVEDAVRMRGVFPEWRSGEQYSEGFRVSHGDSLWRCLQGHVSQDDWNPPYAPSLWAKVLVQTDPETGEQAVSAWVQPDSTNPYQVGDRVTHKGETWSSKVPDNVWEPGVYGWELVE